MGEMNNLFQKDGITSVEDVIVQARENKEYKYIWAVQLDKVVLGRLEEKELDLEKLVEARIFGNGCEIHLFQQDEWAAIETINWKEHFIEETQKIKKVDRKRFGSSITIRHYIAFGNEDKENRNPQAYICGSCLNGWEE